MLDNVALWFGILAGLAVAAQVAGTVMKRIKRVQMLHAAKQHQVREASRRMREKARITLDLRREERSMERELQELGVGIDQGEEAVAKERGSESHIYVLDDRRNPGDQAFIVPVRHPNFASLGRTAPAEVLGSWQHGRRYLVWAAAEKMAQAKAAMRFTADKGYAVGQPEPYQGDPEAL
ncbi:hypothetical protein HHL28_00880 [Aerophototrophica crusticola]|uniref:Uncharacterized protein n=1 Tax=Aerophototrophica crusticola TaxID=1709002 RepID=A0A858R433_9PROT|nr:hypothetical protein HHL28_00880 [Rhodospirillaceae bacterium B3]